MNGSSVHKAILEVPEGIKHIEVVFDKETGQILNVMHYAEGELHEFFLKIGIALGLHKKAETPSVPELVSSPASQ